MGLPDGWRPMGAVAVGYPAESSPARVRPATPADFLLVR